MAEPPGDKTVPQGARDLYGANASYGTHVAGPVRYLPVELGGEVIGYLYMGVREKAASYIRKLGVQDNRAGFAGATVWSQRLLDARRDGLSPENALRRWIGAEEDPQAGAIPAGAEFADASSKEELRQYINPGYADPPLPVEPQSVLPDGAPLDRDAPGGWGPMGPVRTDYPEGYRLVSDRPVRYLPVYQGDTLLGYVWAAESDDAAGFAERTLPGGKGARALTAWVRRFEECKSEGVTPLQGLRRWQGAAEHPVAGRIPSDAQERTAADSKEVESRTWQGAESAGPGHAPPDDSAASMDKPEQAVGQVGAEYFPDGTPVDRSKGWGPLGPFRLDSPGYTMATDSAVRYLPAYLDDQLVGYLWAAETDDAAGFVPRVKARVDGHRAESRWITLLEQCERAGLRPLEMLRSWIGAPQDPKAGGIPPDAQERSAPSLHDLNVHARD